MPPSERERRARAERRRRPWWSVYYGSFNPRRRTPPRRIDESGFQALDWHSPHLMGVAVGILLLNVGDALMTVGLLAGGADEINPLMALLVFRNVLAFAAVKMGLTSMSVVLFVLLARYRFMRVLTVEWALYAVLAAYLGLIGYEVWMLSTPQ
jgi:hypothetical protein